MTNDGTGDFGTIQIAIDYAAIGDTILVGPGTYFENLIMNAKDLVLKSEVGREATILDGSYQEASVILCRDGLTNATVIEGFTITRGTGTDIFSTGSRLGGGIDCFNAAPIIRNNLISENRAGTRGGGISFGGSSNPSTILIELNTISHNVAWANGGGINIGGKCTIRNNVIYGNITEAGDGAGLYYFNGPGPITIEGNSILGNLSGDHGGGIYLVADSPGAPTPENLKVFGNVLIGNEARERIAGDGAGGGMWLSGGFYIYQNTIAFNYAESGRVPPGGGLCLLNARPGTVIEKNVIQGNTEGGVAVTETLPAVVSLKHNLLFSNGSMDVFDPGAAIVATENVFVDALFCTPGKDSQGELAEDSPALSPALGPIGALTNPGCGAVAVQKTTWGRIKLTYAPRRIHMPGGH